MKYWYLYDLTDNKPVNAGHLPNKLALYTWHDSVKKGLVYLNTYNSREHKYEIREVEF